MTIEVEIAGTGQIAEFPDGTPPDVIQRALAGVQDAPARDIIDTRDSDTRPADFAGAGFIEPAATLVTGALAEPVAGIAGIAQSINPFADPGAGARAVEATREALTFQPRTQAGQESLQAVGEFVEPVTEALTGAEKFLGDATFDATGSPALSAAAATIPTVLLEALGVASVKGGVKSAGKVAKQAEAAGITKAVSQAAPTIDQLKDTSRAVFKEIDDAGSRIKRSAFNKLAKSIKDEAFEGGFRDVQGLDSRVKVVLNEAEKLKGTSPSLKQIDAIRDLAKKATESNDTVESALGNRLIDTVDSFLDNTDINKTFTKPKQVAGLSERYKIARNLWGRARKSEVIQDIFKKAELDADAATSLSNQFKSLLKNNKRSRFFNASEKAAMARVAKDPASVNIAKTIGKLRFTDKNIFGGSLGVILGQQFLGGPVGAVAVPIIGSVSKKLSERLVRNNARFADEVVRAGDNAREIARVYLKNTPAKLRSADELSQLLMRPEIDFADIQKSKGLLREAAELAVGNRALQMASGAGIASVPITVKNNED